MHYEFNLMQEFVPPWGVFGDPLYAEIKARPPEGCVVENFDGIFGLACVREAGTIVAAVAELVAEIYDRYGLLMDSLGVEKPHEWFGDDAEGYSGIITAHLLLAAAARMTQLGFTHEDVTSFFTKVVVPRKP